MSGWGWTSTQSIPAPTSVLPLSYVFPLPIEVQLCSLPCDDYQAYLKQAGARPNLKVLVNAPVAKVLSTTPEFVASGVEFLFDGATHTVNTTSNGEVIISAGYVPLPSCSTPGRGQDG